MLQGCEYVHDVVVPAQDDIAPLTAATVWEPSTGEHLWLEGGTLHSSDPNESHIVIGAGFDGGGVKELHFLSWFKVRKGSKSQNFHNDAITKKQSAFPGQVADNGLWIPAVVTPAQLAPNGDWDELTYNYRVSVVDFHNNISHGDWAKIVCTP